MSKTLGAFSCLVVAMGSRFSGVSDRYIDIYFDNAHTSYAEVSVSNHFLLSQLLTVVDFEDSGVHRFNHWLPYGLSMDTLLRFSG